MKIGYIRSIKESTQEDQTLELEQRDCKKFFVENANHQSQLYKMIDQSNKDDIIFITEFEVLSNKIFDFLTIVEQITSKGIRLYSIKEDFSTDIFKNSDVYNFFSGLLTYRKLTNTKHHLRYHAKATGEDKKKYNTVIQMLEDKKPITHIAAKTELSRNTIYRILKDYEEENK